MKVITMSYLKVNNLSYLIGPSILLNHIQTHNYISHELGYEIHLFIF